MYNIFILVFTKIAVNRPEDRECELYIYSSPQGWRLFVSSRVSRPKCNTTRVADDDVAVHRVCVHSRVYISILYIGCIYIYCRRKTDGRGLWQIDAHGRVY